MKLVFQQTLNEGKFIAIHISLLKGEFCRTPSNPPTFQLDPNLVFKALKGFFN